MLRRGSPIARILALALLAAVPLAVYAVVVEPIVAAYRDADATIAQAQALLQSYRQRAGQREQLSSLLAEEQARAENLVGYLQATEDALAAAELQDRLKLVVEGAGGTLRSAQNVEAEAVDAAAPVRRAGLKIRFSADIESLAAILYELETGQPYLFIDELSMREERRRRRRDEAEGPLDLDVVIDVYGYLRTAST